jgi:hypothetical protein
MLKEFTMAAAHVDAARIFSEDCFEDAKHAQFVALIDGRVELLAFDTDGHAAAFWRDYGL